VGRETSWCQIGSGALADGSMAPCPRAGSEDELGSDDAWAPAGAPSPALWGSQWDNSDKAASASSGAAVEARTRILRRLDIESTPTIAKEWRRAIARISQRFPKQTGKMAVVTGANSGVGWETARGLAQAGAHVVLACRNETRAREAAERIVASDTHLAVEPMVLDLASLESISRFALDYRARFNHLDILVNNAGVMFTERSLTRDGVELQFGVNHLGHFALTAHLFPVLRKTPDCRIVTVTSAFHWFATFDLDRAHTENGYDGVWSYAFSKLCNLLFAFEFARRLRKGGLAAKSMAAHPGLTKTQLAAHSPLTRFFTTFVGQSAKSGAVPVLHAAMHPGVDSGALYGPALGLWGGARKDLASPAAGNLEHAMQLWQKSEELARIRFQLGDDAAA